ncbi:hypothetical protein GGI23_007851, partial [Coemansia sp. RSA 2559]
MDRNYDCAGADRGATGSVVSQGSAYLYNPDTDISLVVASAATKHTTFITTVKSVAAAAAYATPLAAAAIAETMQNAAVEDAPST